MAPGPRVTRKDLKEDKVYVTMAGVVDFCIRNRFPIALIALGVLAVFAVVFYWRLQTQNISANASWARYQTTHIELPSERTAALRNVAAEYPKTAAGRFAAYEVANILYENGRYDEALEAFQEFLKKNGGHLLAPSAMEAIGYCQESLSQWKEAIETYQKLILNRADSPAAARAHYRLGLCFERTAEKESAIEAYEKTVELLPDSLWARYANERLESLKPPDASSTETLSTVPVPVKTTPVSEE